MSVASFSKFPLVQLATVATIQPGYAFASDRFTADPADVPLVKGENVQQGYIDWGASRYWPSAHINESVAYVLNVGDVVVAMDRPWVPAGLKWAYIRPEDPKALLVQRVARLKAKAPLDQTFLRVLISSAYFAGYIQPIVTGVNVPHISARQIGGFLVPLPDSKVQKQIAALVSAYDDLIANNQRRIALLENMAEEIYREWFVRMRFPGHDASESVRGLPAGWSQKQISEVAEINAHNVRRGHEPELIRYLDISAVGTNWMEEPIEMPYASAPGRARRLVRSGDILWSSVRPGNRSYCIVIEPPDNLIASTGFAVISPKPGTPYTYLHMSLTTQNFVEQMVAVAKGAAYPATGFDDFGKALVIWPTAELLEAFHRICQPMYESVAALRKACSGLRKQRDALLPRLISGQLKVDHLDIRLPPSMQPDAAA